MFTLSPDYGTTRLVTREAPTIEEAPNTAFKTVLFLPEGEGRQGEGGLRTQGYFKRSLPDKPLITVITVVYNGVAHLEETILSVIGQTYDNVEYIIIDGGSTDGTLDIIRRYKHAIDYWVSEKDRGIYDAMNKGIDLTTGDWINFMNGGDCFFNQFILYEIFLNSHSENIIFGNTLFKYDAQNFSIKSPKIPIKFNYGLPFCHQSVFTTKSLQKQNKFNCTYTIYADFDLFATLFKKNNDYKYVNLTISSVTYDGVSSIKKTKHYKELFKIGEKHYKFNFALILILDTLTRSMVKKLIPLRITRKIQLSKK